MFPASPEHLMLSITGNGLSTTTHWKQGARKILASQVAPSFQVGKYTWSQFQIANIEELVLWKNEQHLCGLVDCIESHNAGEAYDEQRQSLKFAIQINHGFNPNQYCDMGARTAYTNSVMYLTRPGDFHGFLFEFTAPNGAYFTVADIVRNITIHVKYTFTDYPFEDCIFEGMDTKEIGDAHNWKMENWKCIVKHDDASGDHEVVELMKARSDYVFCIKWGKGKAGGT